MTVSKLRKNKIGNLHGIDIYVDPALKSNEIKFINGSVIHDVKGKEKIRGFGGFVYFDPTMDYVVVIPTPKSNEENDPLFADFKKRVWWRRLLRWMK